MMRLLIRMIAAVAAVAAPVPSRAQEPGPRHAIAMQGEPALAPGFANFPFVDPNAPKGGRVTLAYAGTFDSLNPFNVKALTTAQGLNSNVFQSLMLRSLDEPFTLYAQIAQSIETDEARSYVVFRLDPRAHFSDGAPLTADDVVFTFNLFKAKGRPQQRDAYKRVRSLTKIDARTLRYDLTGADDRELPLTLALMYVLPAHRTDAEHFEETTLAVPTGSGPYVVTEVKPGERLTLKRDPGYWGNDLPVARGQYNFDEIRIDYYRDDNAMFEALTAGAVDYRFETNPTRWLKSYDFPALREGRVIRETVPFGLPKGMEGFVFNSRRPQFADARVREALGLMFDFDWINANLYGGLYRRSQSYFDDSELSSRGRPADALERALLAPYPGAVRADILENGWSPPPSDGSGRDRAAARKALALLAEAGYALKDGALRSAATGEPFTFEIVIRDRAQERLTLNFAENLKRIGVTARTRLVDEVQGQRRRQRFDFDMMVGSWVASPSPGNEQRSRWGAASADIEGSFNLAGAREPAIEALIDAMLRARSRADYLAAVRAFDRVLLSQFYIVPFFYTPEQWIARSSSLGRPPRAPLFGVLPAAASFIDSWWRAP